MALREKWVSFRFTDGLNTESNPKVLETGEFTRLENCVFTENVTSVKRFGSDRLSTSVIGSTYSRLSGALGLSARDDEAEMVILSTTDELFAQVPDCPGGGGYLKVGDWWSGRISDLPLIRRSYEAFDGSTTSSGSIRLVAWEDARGGVRGQLWDDNRGGSFSDDFAVGGTRGRRASCVTVASKMLTFFASGSSTFVGVVPVIANGRLGDINELRQSLNASQDFDVVSVGSYAVMASLDSACNLYLDIVTENGFVGNAHTVPPFPTGSVLVASASLGTPSLAVSPDLSTIAVSYCNPSGVPLFHLYRSSDLRLLGDDTVLDADAVHLGGVRRLGTVFDPSLTLSPPQLHVFIETSASLASNRTVRHTVSTVTGNLSSVLQSGSLIRHSSLASKPFPMDGRVFTYVTHLSDDQATDFLVRSDNLICGMSRYGQALTDVSGNLSNVDLTTTGGPVYRACTNRELLPGIDPDNSGSTFSDRHLMLTCTTSRPSSSWRPIDVDGCLMMPGGWLGKYDGSHVTENGWALMVEGLSGTVSNNGGASATDTVLYAVVPEAFDARGNRELGAYVSLFSSGYVTPTSTMTLTWPTIVHTYRDGTRAPAFRYAVYKTAIDGDLLQRIDTHSNQAVNDVTVDTVTFVDTVVEAVRAEGEVCYTEFEAKNVMPAAPSTLALCGDRLYLAGLEGDPYTVAVSKVRGGGAISFSAAGTVAFESVGGPLTALHALDDNVIAAFKRSKVYALVADGPSNLSSDTTPFPLPVLKTSDVGAPYPPTTLSFAGETLQGVLFDSERGIRLLDRSATVQNVGWPVKKFDGYHVVGGSAPRLAEEARFYTSEGETLVLNTRFSRWSSFPGQYAVGATIWDGRPAYVGSDGFVHVETTSSYYDGSHAISQVAETGWIPLDAPALQGLSRVRYIDILGEFYSPHTLRVEMAFDYRDSWVVVREAVTSTFMSGAVVYGGPTGSMTFVSASSPFSGFGTFNGQTVGIDAFSGSTAMADHILGIWGNGLQFKLQTGAAEVGYLESVSARSGTFYSINGDTTALQLQQALTGSRLFRLDPKAVSLEDTFISNAGTLLLEADLTGGLGTVLSGSYGEGHYGGIDPVYRLRINMPTQKVTTIRLRISDVGTSGNGRGMSLTELRLRVATDGGKADLTRGRQW